MRLPQLLLKCLLLPLVAVILMAPKSEATHVVGGDIYWECLPSGEFEIFLKLYRDCSQNTLMNVNDHFFTIQNHPDFVNTQIPLTLVSETDITTGNCGVPCGSANAGDISIREYIFSSGPIQISGVPPANGFVIEYYRCCRTTSTNIVDAQNQEIFYSATMYPFNGQDVYPCFDSSPQFAEKPTSVLCSGYELRYNSDAVDENLDSLSYQLVDALGSGGSNVTYQPGYSGSSPLPGPAVNPGYAPVTLDPVTGQLSYDAPSNEQGDWTVVIAVFGWRCGQLVSRTIREMNVTLLACTEANNIPQVPPPNWTSPLGATGYSITVNAGDLVTFDISGTDNDQTAGVAQVLEFTASGSQFDQSVSGQAGCIAPCATLSNVSPPASGTGTISTQFTWQTTCDHIATYQECATLTSTYNFLFKFRDDFCPASGSNFVNVAVTVVGEPVVESPEPRCTSVDADGNVTITWETVTDNSIPPSFVEYVIYHSTSPNGPFDTEVGTVADINTGSWTHTTANANPPTTAGPNYYVVRTRSGCNDATLDAPKDTIASMHLTMSTTATTVDLSWTLVNSPELPSSNGPGLYQIFREDPIGVWSYVTSTPSLNYSEPIIWCNDSVNYRIELSDNLPCTSTSNIVGDVLSIIDPPEPQRIDSVSVDKTTGLAVIGWSPNPQPSVIEYIIEQNPDLIAWGQLHTAVGYNNTFWENPASQASSESEYYRLKATNNCNQTGTSDEYHQTIYLTTVADGCNRAVNLEWNEYVNWPGGVEKYEILVSKDGGAIQKIGETADTIGTFTHTGVEELATYCYCVRAIQNAPTRFTSTSNESCTFVYVPKRPDYSYHYNTTVQPGNTGVETYFFVDSVAGYLGYEIQRGTSPDDLSYQWFIPYDADTRYYSYTDAGSRPESTSYYYQVIGVDSCEQFADTLNMNRTIYLEAEANLDRTNSLQWNGYEGWNGPIIGYNIFRSVDGTFDYLNTVAPTELTYLDNVEEIIVGEGNFCYYIEAIEGTDVPVGNPPATFMERSRSNEACAKQHPNVFMPNAFMPEGINNVFKPVTRFVDTDSYLFQIYDRWGKRVFESTDPELGWNGNSGSNQLPQGAYVYYVHFVSSNGQTYTKRGSVTLIR